MSWEMMLAYAFMVLLGTGLMHWIGANQLNTKSGVAYYRRYLPEAARKQWGDARLRDEVAQVHKSVTGWLLDLLVVLTLVAAVVIAQEITRGEAGAGGSIKYVMILIMVAVPLSWVVHKIRSTIYGTALRAKAANVVEAKIPKAKGKKRK